MAKPEHLDKLIESVEVWNMWRDDNPGIAPALWGADLEEADLRGVDLKRADLEEADFSGADLSGSNLSGAKLRGAKLRGATFLRANQLSKAKTLYQAELDPFLEQEVRHKSPLLFEKPREKANR